MANFVVNVVNEIVEGVPGTPVRKIRQTFSGKLIDFSPFDVKSIGKNTLLVSGQRGAELEALCVLYTSQSCGEEIVDEAIALYR